jgi:tellurite methyltransferase
MTWNDYLKHTKDRAAHALMLEALLYVKQKEYALDLGCGALRDTKSLVEHGFNHVDAIDSNGSIQDLLNGIEVSIKKNITFIPISFSDFDFPSSHYDLVNAQYSLPFIGNESFQAVMSRMKESLKAHGVFTGQFFGLEDAWADRPNIHFSSSDEVQSFFSPLHDWTIMKLSEFKGNRKTAAGEEKHWHVYDVIAIKN